MTTTAPLRSAHRNWARPVRLENRLAYRLGHEAAGSVIPIAGGRIPPNGPSGIVESVPPESETSLEPQAAGRRPQRTGQRTAEQRAIAYSLDDGGTPWVPGSADGPERRSPYALQILVAA
jgi:hypothetical protein